MNTRRKRNTNQSKEFVRSSLSESTEALRPSTKRQPNSNAWSTPKGGDSELNFDNLTDADLVNADELFGSLGGSLGSLSGSLGNSFTLAPTPKHQKAPPVPSFSFEQPRVIQQQQQPQFQQNIPPQQHHFQAPPPPTRSLNIPMTWNGQAEQYNSQPPPIPQPEQEEWGEEEDAVLREGVLRYGVGDWDAVSRHLLPSHCRRSASACEARWSIVKSNVVKGPWLPEEDLLLRDLVGKIGAKKWSVIASSIPGRAGKQCRERWLNHLDSTVKKCDWSEEEDAQLIAAQRMMGNKWSDIAKLLPGRAENAVKNRYNSLITKKIAKRTANIAAKAEQEFQREATAEQTRVEMAQSLRGKNVLQQIFSVVPPVPGNNTSKLQGGGGLNLHLDTGSDADEVAIELDLQAPDSELPLEHLAMTKKYVEQERERAALFQDVAFSSGEFRDIESLVRGQSNSSLEQQGLSAMKQPTISHSPRRHKNKNMDDNGGGLAINNAFSPRTSRGSTNKLHDELGDHMDAFKSLSIDQDAWDAVLENSGLDTSLGSNPASRRSQQQQQHWASPRHSINTNQEHSNIGTRFSLSRNLGSPHGGGGNMLAPPHLDLGLESSLGNGGSLGGGGLDHIRTSQHVQPNQPPRYSLDNMRLSSSFGNAAAKVANNNSKSKTSANHGEGGEGDPNADSLESRLSGMSIEEEEWRGLDGVALGIGSLNGSMRDAGKPSSNNGSGAFRLSPRDDWVFRSSQHSAAEGAAAAALSGSLGNQPYPTSHSMLHDNQYDELGDSIHHTQQFSHNPSRRIPSPTGSMDEEDWDLLCVLGSTPKGMSASSPSMLSYNHNYNGHGGGGIGKNNQSSIPLQTSTSLPRKQKNRTVNRVSPPRGHSPPKSSMNGRMTPRAQALMTLNEDFKAGRIDKDEKLRMKEKILHGK